MRRLAFIHQLSQWPNLTWGGDVLAPLLAGVRHKQGRLLGRMEHLGFVVRAEATFTTLMADVIKTSAIEGEILNPDQVRSSLAKHLGLDAGGLPPAGRDVDGVVEMMLDATQRYELPLTADRLYGWHALLFPSARSGLRRTAVGSWRPEGTDPMQVVSGRIGNERVRFEAPVASRLDAEMSQFLAWFESAGTIDPVLRAAVAHFWFVTIHPFEDGNGRIARAIADLALARSDRSRERFFSMSSQIEHERKQYYLELEQAQRGGLDITAWLVWFLSCLERSIDAAESSLAGVLHKARLWERINRAPINERQRAVLNRLMDKFDGLLTSSKYAKLAKCSPDTALRDLQELVARGVLVQSQAGGRSTSYQLAEPEAIRP